MALSEQTAQELLGITKGMQHCQPVEFARRTPTQFIDDLIRHAFGNNGVGRITERGAVAMREITENRAEAEQIVAGVMGLR